MYIYIPVYRFSIYIYLIYTVDIRTCTRRVVTIHLYIYRYPIEPTHQICIYTMHIYLYGVYIPMHARTMYIVVHQITDHPGPWSRSRPGSSALISSLFPLPRVTAWTGKAMSYKRCAHAAVRCLLGFRHIDHCHVCPSTGCGSWSSGSCGLAAALS